MEVTLDTRNVEHAMDAAEKFLRKGVAGKTRPLVARLLDGLERDATQKAPNATGALRRSARSNIATTPRGAAARVMYGGLAAKYAGNQHEHTEYAHTIADAQAKGRLGPRGTRTLTNKLGRKRKHPLLGYRGGQAQWLYGAPDSAWNTMRATLWQALLDSDVQHIADRELKL
jgi:hypothetical protein